MGRRKARPEPHRRPGGRTVGNDRIPLHGQGRVVPESFTHGSSAERVRWFRTGYETGRLDACDTVRSF